MLSSSQCNWDAEVKLCMPVCSKLAHFIILSVQFEISRSDPVNRASTDRERMFPSGKTLFRESVGCEVPGDKRASSVTAYEVVTCNDISPSSVETARKLPWEVPSLQVSSAFCRIRRDALLINSVFLDRPNHKVVR